ncbi:hypothetical protein NECAME_05293, partial [Necator americanus]
KCLSSLGPEKYDDSDALNDQVFNPLEALNGCITCGVHCHRVCAGPPWSTYTPDGDGEEEKWQCDDCREVLPSLEGTCAAKDSYASCAPEVPSNPARRRRTRMSTASLMRGAVALTIGIVLGYLYFIIFNYAFQNCDKLVDAIYTSELWLESCYDILMASFSALSFVYILQRRYYGAINSNLDKIGRLFINITFSVVWIKVVVFKGYLSHQEGAKEPRTCLSDTVLLIYQELCQRKELESYWCPVVRRNYECSPSDDLHGTQKMWYYINKGILSSSIISCASEFFPVLLVGHWLACGGAEEKAEDIERRQQLRQGVRGLMKEFFKDISRVYVAAPAMSVPPLHISPYLLLFFWIITPIASLACVIRWLVYFYWTIDFDHLIEIHWMTNDIVSLVANVYMFTWYLTNDRLDAHHKAHARGDITILFGCCIVLLIKLVCR